MGEISGALVALRWCCQPYSCRWPSLGDLRGNLSSVLHHHHLRNAAFRGGALTLTPALCGSVLQHVPPHKKAFSAHLTAFTAVLKINISERNLCPAPCSQNDGALCRAGCGMALMMWKLPGSFLPTEDQAKSWCSTRCRPGRPLPVQQNESPDC